MTKKELNELLHLHRSIRSLEEQLKQLDAEYGIDYTLPYVMGGKLKNVVEEIVIKREKLFTEILTERKRLLDLKLKANKEFKKLEEPMRSIMFDRYINGKKWEDVAMDQHYDYRHVIRLHKIAISKTDKTLK